MVQTQKRRKTKVQTKPGPKKNFDSKRTLRTDETQLFRSRRYEHKARVHTAFVHKTVWNIKWSND